MRTAPEVEIVVVSPIMVKIGTAAAMMGVSSMTIYRWIREGELKTIPCGKDQRIEVMELERYAAAHRHDVRDPAEAAAISDAMRAKLKRRQGAKA